MTTTKNAAAFTEIEAIQTTKQPINTDNLNGNKGAATGNNESAVRENLVGSQEMDRAAVIQTAVDNAALTKGFQLVPLFVLTIPHYRVVRPKIEKIAKEWDDRRCEPLVVSFRDGELYIVDGIRRFMAARLIGKENIMCRIMTGLNEDIEGDLFLLQNKNRSPITPYQEIKTQDALGREEGVNILRICAECKVTLGLGRAVGECGCAGAVRDAYRMVGEPGLKWVFGIIEQTGWRHDVGGYKGDIIKALAVMYKESGDHNAVADKLVEKYGKMDPENVRSLAIRRFPRKRNVLLALFQMTCTTIK